MVNTGGFMGKIRLPRNPFVRAALERKNNMGKGRAMLSDKDRSTQSRSFRKKEFRNEIKRSGHDDSSFFFPQSCFALSRYLSAFRIYSCGTSDRLSLSHFSNPVSLQLWELMKEHVCQANMSESTTVIPLTP